MKLIYAIPIISVMVLVHSCLLYHAVMSPPFITSIAIHIGEVDSAQKSENRTKQMGRGGRVVMGQRREILRTYI